MAGGRPRAALSRREAILGAAGACAGLAPSRAYGSVRAGARVWIGPMAFVAGREVRPDFVGTLTDASRWPTTLARAQVFKSYIMLLPPDPLPDHPSPQVSDQEMRRLIGFLRAHRLQTAFEVGGIRLAPTTASDLAGETTAESELAHLARWSRLGGSVDYLTTDHAVMLNVGAHYVDPVGNPDTKMTLEQGTAELVDYYAAVRQRFPSVRLGAIESLGFFEVSGASCRGFARTVPALPLWRFEGYLDGLVSAMRRRGLRLDHFHIDFGYEGAVHDGRGSPDVGRILAVIAAVRARGVRAGVIVNAFHDGMSPGTPAATAARQARENTLRFYRAFLGQGGDADDLVIQTWQPHPARTGPESDPDTVLGVARSILELTPAHP